jgi:hypothetical protein
MFAEVGYFRVNHCVCSTFGSYMDQLIAKMLWERRTTSFNLTIYMIFVLSSFLLSKTFFLLLSMVIIDTILWVSNEPTEHFQYKMPNHS